MRYVPGAVISSVFTANIKSFADLSRSVNTPSELVQVSSLLIFTRDNFYQSAACRSLFNLLFDFD